ncbi:hypothetical protein BN1110_01274 [bacterium YEK0313]|nr:hypothetical protein BN1110_01274 [bacterium YEK0313]
MLIVCPSCATAFRVNAAVLGDGGRQVRCARCRTVWHATFDSALPEPAIVVAEDEAEARAAAPVETPAQDPADDWGAALAAEAHDRDRQANEAPPLPAVPVAESPSIAPVAPAELLPRRADETPGGVAPAAAAATSSRAPPSAAGAPMPRGRAAAACACRCR